MGSRDVDILMVTYRRPHYTRRSLAQLLATCDDDMRVWVWHNGGPGETLDVVRELERHPRLHRLHVSDTNRKLREPTNWLWSESSGAYVSKVDDDCLLPQEWARTLRAAHESAPQLGVVGSWRFQDEDFLPESSKRVVDLPGGHRLLRSCWVQGSGYVMKRECVERQGLLDEPSFTTYCRRLALAGWVNGFYFPFVREDHMDDPRSPNSGLRSDEDLRSFAPIGALTDGVTSVDVWTERVRWNARVIQTAPLDPRWYFGWRRRLRKGWSRVQRALGRRRQAWRTG